MGWLDGYAYRKLITLSRASGAVSNYQMKLLVGESSGATGENVDCGAKCQTDFDDIRFTTSDGTTLLDYWIESISGATPNQLATIWIEFNTIGTAATTFYMYYGNAAATAVSNGVNTFLFFDDFNNASIDAKWSTEGTVIESGTEISIAASSALYTDNAFATNTRWVAQVKATTRASWINLLSCQIDGSNYITVVAYGGDWFTEVDTKAGASDWNEYDVAEDSNYHRHEFTRNGTTNVKHLIDNVLKTTNTTNVPSGSGVLYISTDSGDAAKVEWCFISQFLATEPAWGSWGAQEDYYIAKPGFYPHILAH